MAVPKNTPAGKGIRTAIQGYIVVAPLLIGVLSLPEVQAYVGHNWPTLLPLLPPLIGLVSYLYNKAEGR